jgi:formamidopyrimidine-DNA glycosylase
MPELPDVEGFKRALAGNALRKTIERVEVSDARILGKLSARTFASRLQGARLVAAHRHGKHLMARIDRGGWLTLHFGLSGALQFAPGRAEAPPFTRVRLDFAGDGCLAYTNKRMIGRVGLAPDASDFIAHERLGPDALERLFDFAAFKAAVQGVKRDVKSVLMDQKIIAGIGNIYSDEILFQARIDPAERMDKLAPGRLKRLFREMRTALETSSGSLLPERRKGGRCPRCRSLLKVFKLGGRTAYCCRRCQGC